MELGNFFLSKRFTTFFSKRIPKDAPEASVPSMMGAIERALHNSLNRKDKYIFEPRVGMTFDCVNEAQEFYNIYSWEVGMTLQII